MIGRPDPRTTGDGSEPWGEEIWVRGPDIANGYKTRPGSASPTSKTTTSKYSEISRPLPTAAAQNARIRMLRVLIHRE